MITEGGTNITVEELLLSNSCHEKCRQERRTNIEIWLADEIPTLGAAEVFSGIKLLGNFTGPATFGEEKRIPSQQEWETKSGRYLIVLVRSGYQGRMILNLGKTQADDITCSKHVA